MPEQRCRGGRETFAGDVAGDSREPQTTKIMSATTAVPTRGPSSFGFCTGGAACGVGGVGGGGQGEAAFVSVCLLSIEVVRGRGFICILGDGALLSITAVPVHTEFTEGSGHQVE